jgi:hypothetical protein
VIALAAAIFHHLDLARAAMWVAAIAGAFISPILLIMDLGRRFSSERRVAICPSATPKNPTDAS